MKPTKIALALIIITASLIFTGCDWLSILMSPGCDTIPDSAHCYQTEAIQSGDPSSCEKIKPPAEYAKAGSNPPRDKCYMMIAENTGNYEYCKKMKGGIGSYESSDCFTELAVWKADPKGCKYMTGEAFEACKKELGNVLTTEKLGTVDDEISAIKKALEDDPNDPALKSKLTKLQGTKTEMMEFMTNENRITYTRDQINTVMGEVDDEDVASEIRKDFINLKSKNPNMNFDQLMDGLKKIKEEKEFVKRLDEEANTLVDLLKGSATDYADEKKQEIIDAATEQGWSWVKDKAGSNFYWHIKKLESMKEKYDKYSEDYTAINEKIEKFKKTYDEVSAVYKKVDQFNKMLKEGKINEGQAKVLKGAVLLGKGLEYATEYVPVFGSTISTVTKETFEVTIKLAKKRAERSNSLQKCIDDPEHCDPDTISAY